MQVAAAHRGLRLLAAHLQHGRRIAGQIAVLHDQPARLDLHRRLRLLVLAAKAADQQPFQPQARALDREDRRRAQRLDRHALALRANLHASPDDQAFAIMPGLEHQARVLGRIVHRLAQARLLRAVVGINHDRDRLAPVRLIPRRVGLVREIFRRLLARRRRGFRHRRRLPGAIGRGHGRRFQRGGRGHLPRGSRILLIETVACSGFSRPSATAQLSTAHLATSPEMARFCSSLSASRAQISLIDGPLWRRIWSMIPARRQLTSTKISRRCSPQ